MKNLMLNLFIFILSITSVSAAPAAKPLKVKFKLPSAGVDQVNAITDSGRVYVGTKAGNNITINVPTSSLKGTSFYATNGGRLIGPFLHPVTNDKGALFLVKTPKNADKEKVSTLNFKLKSRAEGENYITVSKAIKGAIFDKKNQYTFSNVPQIGLNLAGATRIKAAVKGDSDSDGVVDSLDVDADGDGITNIADTNTELVSAGVSVKANEGVDVPFTALYLGMSETLNWHLNGSLTSTAIDSVIGGENKFSIAYFFSIPPGDTSGITGGHVICGSELTYCKPTSGGVTGTGVYSGFSDGNQSLQGRLWSSINTDGTEYSLETFNIGGGTDLAFAASIQPRVGTSAFRPGDNYRVDFTNSSGDVVSSKTLTLPPYFLTVPALRAYNTASNDSSSDTLVNYGDTSSAGMNSGNPIVLSTGGDFRGKLRINAWRLQRLAVQPEESGDYKDYGHLTYGVTINNNSGEFSCGELYSGLSSSLTEVASQGTGGSFASHQGANLWPLVDSADDYAPSNLSDSTSIGNNTISFTVDLSACLVRNSLSPGVHNIVLTAVGSDTGHGPNRAAQMIAVNIP